METYKNNDIPAFHPTPRAFQFILDTESPTSDPASDTWNGTNDLAQLIADANLGDSAAQVTPGDRYSKGDDAQNNIGRLYAKRHGVPQDYAQATEWYLKAAEQSHPTAQYNMGSMYEEGEGVPQDYSRAMDWYLKAAEQGHLDGLYNIGSMYEEGEGVPQDFIRLWL
ncbi:hypothetical protein BGZ89_002002 [Linnemannia elongata]|nr:hypothetical protein BGZ89_002002 [Linnemannia elongata]